MYIKTPNKLQALKYLECLGYRIRSFNGTVEEYVERYPWNPGGDTVNVDTESGLLSTGNWDADAHLEDVPFFKQKMLGYVIDVDGEVIKVEGVGEVPKAKVLELLDAPAIESKIFECAGAEERLALLRYFQALGFSCGNKVETFDAHWPWEEFHNVLIRADGGMTVTTTEGVKISNRPVRIKLGPHDIVKCCENVLIGCKVIPVTKVRKLCKPNS